jgi:arsenite methyltransferase
VSSKKRHPKYGIDRPDLIVLGSVGTVFWFALGVSLHNYGILPLETRNAALFLGSIAGALNLYIATAFVVSGRVLKFRQRDKLLDSINWQGVRNILDVGCGPGLLLIGAAKRAPEADAIGIDLWKKHAESGNIPQRTLWNARIEGIESRVEVRSADVRFLPFRDSAFDVVLSRAVLHNLKGRKERQRAIEEIARVLNLHGRVGILLVDSWNLKEYLGLLRSNNMKIDKVSKPRYLPSGLPFLAMIIGIKLPT